MTERIRVRKTVGNLKVVVSGEQPIIFQIEDRTGGRVTFSIGDLNDLQYILDNLKDFANKV